MTQPEDVAEVSPVRVTFTLEENGMETEPSIFGDPMALRIAAEAPSLIIRRRAYEESGLARPEVDARLGLTADEFRVEGDLVVIGPIYNLSLDEFFNELETLGLRYYDDYFELSGNWPAWLAVYTADK